MQGLAVVVLILLVILIILAALYFTGVFGGRGQDGPDLDIEVDPAGRMDPLPGYAKPALVAVRARR